MPHFETSLALLRPVEEVFDFFRRPANLLRLSPPELHLRLLEAPELLQLGSRIVVQGRRWGVPQRLVSEVTAFELNVGFVDELKEGPFRKWVQSHRFETHAEGTKVTLRIDYEPPGGMLGLIVTARLIDTDLQTVSAYRSGKLRELLG